MLSHCGVWHISISVGCDDPEQVLGNDLITVVTQEAKTSSTALAVIGKPGFTSGTFDVVTIGLKQSVLHLLNENLVTEDAWFLIEFDSSWD